MPATLGRRQRGGVNVAGDTKVGQPRPGTEAIAAPSAANGVGVAATRWMVRPRAASNPCASATMPRATWSIGTRSSAASALPGRVRSRPSAISRKTV